MKSKVAEFKTHLMTGISYVLPVIIAGSLVVAVSKIIGFLAGYTDLNEFADTGGFLHYVYLFEQVGWTAIGLLNLVLAAFIAFSIAGRPALAAALVGGALATSTNAGFIGAVVAGFFAGWVTNWVKKKIVINGSLANAVPLIILPLITVGATGILMALVLGGPLGWVNTSLLEWITAMTQSNVNNVVLALVLGAMIAFDMGGPVNKAAWMAGNALLMSGIYLPAIIVNIAICIPPLGYGLATMLKKKNYSPELKESGKGSFVMGIIGITEGAIPFTLKSPLKLIPLNVVAGASGAAIAILLGAHEIMPPVGGVYGFFTVGSGWAYLIGILAGALIIGIGANLLVDFRNEKSEKKAKKTEDKKDELDELEIDFDN
ncbi:PTS fructose transporter subunit IIC [Alkalihalobacillus trypoxylicola]|uniref:PTS fructose transporter subunit IIC n=1 Tax=Alkalihalobacillus trypoxylicola TaxID=519424 RepID=A0A162D5Y8_9BACI|nr:PTS fructose transporter subunit IIC [Alkalihalobacillus trypoxylicola]KYG28237.1 PTS fructose transporter subunit IIC [Alkalihalobacillus trypoxylicola]